MTPHQIDKVVRAFILYLLGTTLFYDAASSVDLVLLMALRDVDLIHTYDWGSAALAYLYWGIDEFVRGARQFCGFWHATHVCFLLLLPSRCPLFFYYYYHYYYLPIAKMRASLGP